MSSENQKRSFDHPHDTPVSAGLRFLVEVLAWVAGPWAAAEVSFWLVIPTIVVLIGLPAVFSTRGDKRQVLVPTPGPLRVVIELLLHAVAIATPWVVWPIPLAIATTIAVVAALLFGIRRLGWLVRGAH